LIAFQFIGSSNGPFVVDVALAPGDTIGGAGGSTFAEPVIVNGFTFVPEPGTPVLLGLGLVGLRSSGRRRP
jgi:hypothetical protein